ncbi:Transposon Ty3-G Gag-Pol polyprotein [Vitis vinifera]|uniref:Transposon Ty3-G Gag-Pol polyprotein n=1 Tax=Vitis vinifera TaxID=29760 RepID=A0A438IC66_VITVI|nr:Transposon Ty3-G Gag-Pol polyprotein [Vitis vinifera]
MPQLSPAAQGTTTTTMSSQTRSSQESNARGESQKDITEIPVVRKFQDVFPDELPGLPPHREFDFSIELDELLGNFLSKYIAMGSPSVVCEEKDDTLRSDKGLLMYLRLEVSWGWLDIIGVLTAPISGELFTVYCDASIMGLGCANATRQGGECYNNALSRKSFGQLSSLELREFEMHVVIEDFELCLGWEGQGEIDENWSMYEDASVRFKGRLCVPKDVELRNELLANAHREKLYHPPWEYQDVSRLKETVLVKWMKRDIAQFVANCQICQQVKVEHQRPTGLLQPLLIPEWKWDHITMDIVIGLLRIRSKKNGVWVIVDRLTKSAHFLAMKTIDSMNSWLSYYLSLVEFAYDNSYQSSIGMTPYEALYGRPCRSPLCWIEMGESHLLGPEIIQETTEKIQLIKEKLKRLPKIDKKVMRTKGEGPWSLKKGIGKCTPDPTWVVDLQDVQISEDTSYMRNLYEFWKLESIGLGTR